MTKFKKTIYLFSIIVFLVSCKNEKTGVDLTSKTRNNYQLRVNSDTILLEGQDYFLSKNVDFPSDNNKVVYTTQREIKLNFNKPNSDSGPTKIFYQDLELINSEESDFVISLPEQEKFKLRIETDFRKPFYFYVLREEETQNMKADTLSKNLANIPCAELRFNGLVNEVNTYEWVIDPDTINSECCAYQPNYELVKYKDVEGCVTYEWKKKSQPVITEQKRDLDRDGDGVIDKLDKCPDERGESKYDGCPPPLSDRDGDGVIDKLDKCPNEKGESKYDGCPPPPSDRDGDGVIDKLDKCPDERGESKYDGCPPPPSDRDGDGVIDKLDKCPDERGESKYDGCPPPPSDRDSDGVPDTVDKCPDVKGSKDHDGCPPPVKKFIPKSSGMIGKLLSIASMDDENELRTRGSIIIAPTKDLILYEVKLVASNDGKIEFMLEGPGIQNMELIKNCNTGHNTIRFNDLKNTVLRGGNTYTLIYSAVDDVKIKQINKSYAKGTANGDVSMSGKMIFYDIKYKF